MSRDLERKLYEFDSVAHQAVDQLIEWIARDRDELIVMAAGRLVEGHYRYRDRLMYEYDADTLKAEAAQEVADAINYLARRQSLNHALRGDIEET